MARASRGAAARTFFMTTLVTLTVTGLSGCSMVAHEQQRDDPLIGQIVDVATQQRLDEAALVERLASADVIYLGESHDNADHHAKQKQLVEALIAKGLKPVIGFEFFDVSQTSWLQQYVSGQASMMQLHKGRSKLTPEQRLRRQLGWERRSDRDWGFYFQLIELAKNHQLTVFGADLPQGLKTRISRGGLESLNPVERHQLAQQQPPADAYRQLMYNKFKEGHCGWGEEPLLTRLYQTWNARNARMAQSIVQMASSAQGQPVVMVLGNGHTEHNRAVVSQVAQLNDRLSQVNLALQSITIEPSPLADYLEPVVLDGVDFGPRHQLLWFTQRNSYHDPCAALNKPES